MADVVAQMQVLGERIAVSLELELIQVQYVKENGGWVLRFLLDKLGGIAIQDCERFSRLVEPEIDAADPIPHHYTLEVSSAGLDRPLLREIDYHRFAGSEVTFRFFAPVEGKRELKAKLIGLSRGEETPLVEMEITGAKTLQVPLKNIARARLVPDL